MRRTDGKNAGSTRGGVDAAARAIERAFGFLERICFRGWRGRAAREVSEPSRAQRRRAAKRMILESEIARLEKELDRVHAHIVQGAGSVRRNAADAAVPELPKLVELARDSREQLHTRRVELSRLERDTARDLRLQQTAELEPAGGLEQRRERANPEPPVGPSGHGGIPLSPKARYVILKASRNASFRDGSQRVIFEKLVQDLIADDPEVRRTAAARIGELGASIALDVLYAALEDPDDKVRASALNSLALLEKEPPVDLFRQFLDSSDHHLRLAALRGLVRVGDPEDGLALLNTLEDDHPAVRKAAATYLGWRGAEGAIRALVSALHDPEAEVRAAAASSLGNMHDDRAALSLIRTLADPERSVREAAKTALETTLGEEIEIDIEAEGEAHASQIEQLKELWREVRIDKHLERDEDLDLQKGPREVRHPPKWLPAPRDAPYQVVELKSSVACRARVGTARKYPPQEKVEVSRENETIEDLEAFRAASAQEKKESWMPVGLDGLGIRVAKEGNDGE